MKSLTLLAISFYFVSISCQHLRNLKLARDPDKYKVLVAAAKETIYQIYGKTVDFANRNEVIIEDNSNCLLKVVVDDNEPEIPKAVNMSNFTIVNGKAIMPEIEFPNLKLEIFGKALDLEEEYRAFANMISAGYKNGKAYIYKKESEITAQARYKCFVNSDDGKECGSFEILTEDKNDYKDIKSKLQRWYEKAKSLIIKHGPVVLTLAQNLVVLKGIKKDLFSSSSSFMNISYLPLLILFLIF